MCISNFTFILRHKWNNIHVYSRSKPMENKNNNKYSLILNIIFIFLTTYHIKIVQYIQGTITASHIFWLWSIIINYQLSNDLFRKPFCFPTLTLSNTNGHDIQTWHKLYLMDKNQYLIMKLYKCTFHTINGQIEWKLRRKDAYMYHGWSGGSCIKLLYMTQQQILMGDYPIKGPYVYYNNIN